MGIHTDKSQKKKYAGEKPHIYNPNQKKRIQ